MTLLIFHFPRERILSILLLSLFVTFIQSVPLTTETSSSTPRLLLISFDGFRWDYPDLYSLPHFDSIAKRGVRVKHIENSFATVTFPSHFTMITGLFEETHGIVANTIYDPILKDVATVRTMNDTKWWSQNPNSEPIWISNQLANDSMKRRSGVIAWPGCSTPINGYIASEYQEYSSNRSFESILQQIFKWFRGPPGSRINFGAIYYPQPDITGHQSGPISPEMNQTLKECDNYVAQLLQIINDDEDLKANLNVIITSDHGMHKVDKTHKIILENLVDTSLFKVYGGRSFANIFVNKSSDIDRLFANLSVIPNYEVYKKSQIPDEYHYKLNVRIGDILIIGKVGYEIIVPGDDASVDLNGDHGYDNRAESMHPIFYGFGPAFRQINRAEPFRNVDLYPLMSHILRLKPRQTNGSLDNVKHILIDFPTNGFVNRIFSSINRFFSQGFLVVSGMMAMMIMAMIFTITACRHSRQPLYAESKHVPIHYRLLSNREGSINNLIASDSDDDVELK